MVEKSDAKVIEGFNEYLNSEGSSSGTVQTYTRIIREFANWLKYNGGNFDQ
ncbi:site-specific integrase [Paenibacillus larvae]|uniref:site-specific integrase n=1 Tax=Paenibacillus larvae TaxID=1464 RepID=UPI000169491C|nr:site-specific integrase [Paenibacillus larvae]MDT2279040.1 site-specific integrase [Paenibacillus larvae]MDT2312699.1 site-specific integrase [Paenibacillus larvae]WOC09618.1 site-specific integrase [Paenibacillus larvae]